MSPIVNNVFVLTQIVKIQILNYFRKVLKGYTFEHPYKCYFNIKSDMVVTKLYLFNEKHPYYVCNCSTASVMIATMSIEDQILLMQCLDLELILNGADK